MEQTRPEQEIRKLNISSSKEQLSSKDNGMGISSPKSNLLMFNDGESSHKIINVSPAKTIIEEEPFKRVLEE